jgi:hypothetical protein
MKKHLPVCLGLLLGLSATAQPIFYATNLPSQVGGYNRSYYSTDSAYVAAMLALYTNSTGGINPPLGPKSPQIWDFSQVQQPSETVLRTDLIAPSAGPDGGSFPLATYAEQDTLEPASQIAWRYYSTTNQGRYYYGFYEPQSVDADSLVVFDQPTVDIPPVVNYGDTWSRTVTWGGHAVNDPIEYVFTTTANVDAYGTLILPSIGVVQGLRVHEVQDYQASWDDWPLEDDPCDYYYWLVPGLGVAVQIIQNQADTSGLLTGENIVERMFYASYFTNPPPPLPSTNLTTGNLHIQLQSRSVLLNWAVFTNSTSYQVQSVPSLASTNWQSLGLTTGTNWSDTLTPTQRFYRVIGTH